MNLFRRFRRGKDVAKAKQELSDAEQEPNVRLQRKEGMVTIDLDSFSAESHAELTEEIVRRSGFLPFEGSIEHGYSKGFVKETGECPRCQSPTHQYTANFIYATDIACRAMLVPAGFFCQACPTVIVDERMVSTGMKSGYRFRRVVGVDYLGKKDPDYFGTWNGEKPTYILDENEQIMDMVLQSDIRKPSSGSRYQSRGAAKKANCKQAAKARRRNRKKR